MPIDISNFAKPDLNEGTGGGPTNSSLGIPKQYASGMDVVVGQGLAINGSLFLVETAHTTAANPDFTKLSYLSTRRRFPDMRDLGAANHAALKLRGVILPTAIDPPTVANSSFWSTGFNLTTLQQWIALAKQTGANIVGAYGTGFDVMAGTQTLAAYLANWQTFLNLALAQGLMVYPLLCEPNTTTLNGASGLLADIEPIVVALAALCDAYPNVPGICVYNELNNGKNTTWATHSLPLVRAVTTKPLTCNVWVNSVPSAGDSYLTTLVAAGVDFLDYHPYYVAGSTVSPVPGDTVAGCAPAPGDFDAIPAAFPSLPILMGEGLSYRGSGSVADPTNLVAGVYANTVRPIVEKQWCAGALVWNYVPYLSGQGGSPGPGGGNFFQSVSGTGLNMTGTENIGTTGAFRCLPRRQRKPLASLPLVVPSAEVALATAMTTVPKSFARLSLTDLAPSGGNDPLARVVAEFGDGLQGGDVLSAQLVDLDSGAVLTSGSVAVPGVLAYPDSGPNNLQLVPNGGVATVASPYAGFGNAAQFAGAGVLVASAPPQFVGGTKVWSVQVKIKCGATPTNGIIAGQGIASGFGTNSAWGINMFASGAVNSVIGFVYDSGNGYQSLGGTAISPVALNAVHEIVLSYDGTTLRLFCDGALVASKAIAALTNILSTLAVPLTVGGQQSTSGGSTYTTYLTSTVDELWLRKVATPYTAAYAPTAVCSGLSTGAAVTSIPLTAALTAALPAANITISDGAGHTQTFVTAGAASAASAIPITSATPNFAYPSGSTIVLGPASSDANTVALYQFDSTSSPNLSAHLQTPPVWVDGSGRNVALQVCNATAARGAITSAALVLEGN